MVMQPKVDESLLVECPALTKWYAKRGDEIVLNAIEWRKMYQKCALNNNELIKAVRVIDGR